MKLHYYSGQHSKLQVTNFGDELNPWLWRQLIPDIIDSPGNALLIGIGTLLNQHLPPQPQKAVFGAGIGYGDLPHLDDSYKIYFVRGFLSAKALELPPEQTITDPAILTRRCYQPTAHPAYRWSYMPHFSEMLSNRSGWQTLCQETGIHLIDPTAPIDQVLAEISASEVLFAEAMHGAIIADALRTPWVAVKTKAGILDLKWNDWLSTIDRTYQPVVIRRAASIIGKKGWLRHCDYQAIRAQMALMVRTARPVLSAEAKGQELEEKVMLKLEELRTDFHRGVFH